MKRVFPQIVHFENSIVKKKSLCERLLDSQNSIVKKKSSCERLLDRQNSIVKKKKFREKGFLTARILLRKEEEFVKKAPLKPKSHRQRDSHRKGLRQQQVVA
jgi:hypothetical protein